MNEDGREVFMKKKKKKKRLVSLLSLYIKVHGFGVSLELFLVGFENKKEPKGVVVWVSLCLYFCIYI